MGPDINVCRSHIYAYVGNQWIDVTDLKDACISLADKADKGDPDLVGDDDDIPFCEMDCDNCPECDQMDDFEIVDEDQAELYEGDEPPCWGIPDVDSVIFSDPATIVFWSDGTKTVVKCMAGEKFERYAGFAMACMKKMFGSTSRAKVIMNECDRANWVKPKVSDETKPETKEIQPKTKSVSLNDLVNAFTEAVRKVAEDKEKEEESIDETPAG